MLPQEPFFYLLQLLYLIHEKWIFFWGYYKMLVRIFSKIKKTKLWGFMTFMLKDFKVNILHHVKKSIVMKMFY